jgi:hypothetical protein
VHANLHTYKHTHTHARAYHGKPCDAQDLAHCKPVLLPSPNVGMHQAGQLAGTVGQEGLKQLQADMNGFEHREHVRGYGHALSWLAGT